MESSIRYGWLSPDGVIYDAHRPAGHYDCAMRIITDGIITDTFNPIICSPSQFLMARGWLHVSAYSFGGFDGKRPTPQQYDWLNEFTIACGRSGVSCNGAMHKEFIDKDSVLSGHMDYRDVPNYSNGWEE